MQKSITFYNPHLKTPQLKLPHQALDDGKLDKKGVRTKRETLVIRAVMCTKNWFNWNSEEGKGVGIMTASLALNKLKKWIKNSIFSQRSSKISEPGRSELEKVFF